VNLIETLYSLSMTVARPVLPLAGAVSPRLSSAAAGWRSSAVAIRQWASAHRDPDRPLLWLHGSSAGEIAGGAPVVRELRRRTPDLQILVTHFSPSGAAAAEALQPDLVAYLPFDSMSEVGRVLDAVAPDAVVFAKLDVWPGLTRAAEHRGIPLGMINATVRPSSSRLGPLARRLLTPAYCRLGAVGAVSDADEERLAALGVEPGVIRVTGDAAFDEALVRLDGSTAAARRLAPRHPERVRLVAGSTWPEDDQVLLGAVRELRDDGVEIDLVLVPHQPTEHAVRALTALCAQALVRAPRIWSAGDRDPAAGALIVDSVGLLADLYAEGDIAWVGGGFGSSGLHSVLEPAAAGIPILFGPRYERFEGVDLTRLGAADVVRPETAARTLHTLVRDAELRGEMGRRARAYAERGRGAATAGADLVAGLMLRTSPSGAE
jgi:3-deoxy-D-manno-octulosonic-acid transferase